MFRANAAAEILPSDPLELYPDLRPADSDQDIIVEVADIESASEYLPGLAARKHGALIVRQFFDGTLEDLKAHNFSDGQKAFLQQVADATNCIPNTQVALRIRNLPNTDTNGSALTTTFSEPSKMHIDGFYKLIPAYQSPEVDVAPSILDFTPVLESEVDSEDEFEDEPEDEAVQDFIITTKFLEEDEYLGVGHHVTYAGHFMLALCRLTVEESNSLDFELALGEALDMYVLADSKWSAYRGFYSPVGRGDLVLLHQYGVTGQPNYLHGTFGTSEDRQSIVFDPFIPPPPPPVPPLTIESRRRPGRVNPPVMPPPLPPLPNPQNTRL